MCNGDNDCGDYSDEEECVKINSPCGTVAVTESDIGLGAGYGSATNNRKNIITVLKKSRR